MTFLLASLWAVIRQEGAMPPDTEYIPYERLGSWVAMVPKWPFKFGSLAGDSITSSKLKYALEEFFFDDIEDVVVMLEFLSLSINDIMWFKYCIDDITQALLINYDSIVLIMF